MSMHKIELTDLERQGLKLHGLAIGTPSQSSDCFRNGIKWALENTRTQSQWISVADDFPKDYEEVYIWPRPDYGYECFTGIYDKNYQCWIAESHNDYGSERHKVNVTHWANLPLTPKEQGQ